VGKYAVGAARSRRRASRPPLRRLVAETCFESSDMSITRGLHVHNSRLAASTLPIPLPVIAAECDHPSQANEAGTSALVPMQPHF
jgi:hypothetical protein